MMCFFVFLFTHVWCCSCGKRQSLHYAVFNIYFRCSQSEVPAANGRVNVLCLTAEEVTVVTSCIEVGVGYRSDIPIYIKSINTLVLVLYVIR